MNTPPAGVTNLALELGPDYEVLGELGRGGSSVVHLGRDRILGRRVAIKVIRDFGSGDGETTARLEREAKMLASEGIASSGPFT